jgi:hypothetical protein
MAYGDGVIGRRITELGPTPHPHAVQGSDSGRAQGEAARENKESAKK